MRLSKNFSLSEFEVSQTAARAGIDNRVPPRLRHKAVKLAQRAEHIRAVLHAEKGHECGVIITSGYRSEQVNALVGGSARSHHMRLEAFDFIAPRFGTPFEICELLANWRDKIGIEQLIYEGSWVHVGFIRVAKVNRVLTAVFKENKETSYTRGIVRG